MKFRQNSLLFYQSEILYTVVTVLCLSFIPMWGIELSLLFAFPLVILMLITPKLHNEFISINEHGISCNKAGVLLWEYDWNQIYTLKKSSRFLMPSIEVVTYSGHRESGQYIATNHYFQLGRAARKALTQFYTSKGDSLNQ